MMVENFKGTQDDLFRSYYKKYYCEHLDELKVYFVPDEWSHIDAFSIKDSIIFYDLSLVREFDLSIMECYSCIAHEVGHYICPSREDMNDQCDREFFADQYVVSLGLADYLISALNKMCPNADLTQPRINRISNKSKL